MKKVFVITAIAGILLSQPCIGQKDTITSSGETKGKYFSRSLTPVIDAKMNDWGDTLLNFDNSTKCIYSIANDGSNLYIAIKATDRLLQMKMIQGGMEIFIDDKVKKKQSIGVKFPIGGGSMQMPTGSTSEADPMERRKQLRQQLLFMELTGFKNEINGKQSIYSDVQVKPAMDWDDKDNLVYELAIPFSSLPENVVANLSNISIGIFIYGLTMPEGMGGGRMPGGGSPGGGRPPGGGMRPPGGGSMPDRSQMDNMTKENSFWTKYTIYKK
jgi:hypothetical protein